METLLTHWLVEMQGNIRKKKDLPVFPEGEEYFRELWATKVEREEWQPLDRAKIEGILTKPGGRKAPGYDGLQYFAYKTAHRKALLKYWKALFNWQYTHGEILPSWKVAIQIFLPKPNKANYQLPKSWRPITLFTAAYKILCATITNRVIRRTQRADQWSLAQKGGLPGLNGTTDATFIMRSSIDHHRRHKTNLYVLLMDNSNAFGSLE